MAKRLVIDTNVLVASLSSRSHFHWIIKQLLSANFELYITVEIILEYEEVLKRKYSATVASDFIVTLHHLANVHFTDIYFRWNLLSDPDDNKFVDCYLASNADFLVTNDSDFNLLKRVAFPKVNVISILELESLKL